jgi:hypothetical protein
MRRSDGHTLTGVPSFSLRLGNFLTATALVACSGGVPIDVTVGPLGFDVDVSRFAVPPALQSSGTIARVPCSATAACPPAPGLTLRCVSGACDPDPVTADLGISSVVDLSTYSSELGTLGSNLSTVSVTAMSWQASAAGLRVPVGPIDVFWGPESASGITSDGVRRLGTLPVIRFDAAGMASGDVALDAAGGEALSNHLLNTSRRFRFFARATVDLSPGGALPAGRASIQVRMRVHAESRLLR